MATQSKFLDVEIKHFEHFRKQILDRPDLCQKTIDHMLKLGIIEVSTAFEQALARVGNHVAVSENQGDLLRGDEYSDAKLSTVRTSNYGRTYSAGVRGFANKTGDLRVQVYERLQDRFYYFVIPHWAYRPIPRSSNIEIPFDLEGNPPRQRDSRIRRYANWWRFQVGSWEEMATTSGLTQQQYVKKQCQREHKYQYANT